MSIACLIYLFVIACLPFSASQGTSFLETTLPPQPSSVSATTVSVSIKQGNRTLHQIDQTWDSSRLFQLTEGQYQVYYRVQKNNTQNCTSHYEDCASGADFPEGVIELHADQDLELCLNPKCDDEDKKGFFLSLPFWARLSIVVGGGVIILGLMVCCCVAWKRRRDEYQEIIEKRAAGAEYPCSVTGCKVMTLSTTVQVMTSSYFCPAHNQCFVPNCTDAPTSVTEDNKPICGNHQSQGYAQCCVNIPLVANKTYSSKQCDSTEIQLRLDGGKGICDKHRICAVFKCTQPGKHWIDSWKQAFCEAHQNLTKAARCSAITCQAPPILFVDVDMIYCAIHLALLPVCNKCHAPARYKNVCCRKHGGSTGGSTSSKKQGGFSATSLADSILSSNSSASPTSSSSASSSSYSGSSSTPSTTSVTSTSASMCLVPRCMEHPMYKTSDKKPICAQHRLDRFYTVCYMSGCGENQNLYRFKDSGRAICQNCRSCAVKDCKHRATRWSFASQVGVCQTHKSCSQLSCKNSTVVVESEGQWFCMEHRAQAKNNPKTMMGYEEIVTEDSSIN